MDLLAAFKAQAAFVAEKTAWHAEHGYSDDDIDYLPGSLRLLEALQSDHYHSMELGSGDTPPLMRDTEGAVSADACDASRQVIAEYGMYAGDFGPQSVFDFLGVR